MDKITINKIGDNYWYVPTVFTTSRRKWHQRPYKSLRKLLTIEKHLDDNLIVRLNGDKELVVFRALQQLKGIPLMLNKPQIAALEAKEVLTIRVGRLNPAICIDFKALHALRRGFLPFFSKAFLNREFRNDVAIIWRKHGFVSYKMKK